MFVLQSQQSSTSSGVWRFAETTGKPLGQFSYENEGYVSMSVTARGEIFATTNIVGQYYIQRFNAAGQYLDVVWDDWAAGLIAVSRGPDGNLYCLHYDENWEPERVICLDRPGARVFVAKGSGGMSHPVWMTFGPGGDLYVADRDAGILRFDGITGAPRGVFVPLGRGGLATITRFIFGPDGRLYVSTGAGNSVLRFDGTTGAFIDTFIAPGSGGLASAWGLAFGPDGNLCVVSRDTNQVLRYSGANGGYVGIAAADPALRAPLDIGFSSRTTTDAIWFDDALPAGAVTNAPWQWSAQNPAPYSGTLAHHSPTGGGLREHTFNFASDTMSVGVGDALVLQVYVDDSYGSGEIMVSWCDGEGWEHRAYWGSDNINYGQNNTPSRRYMGRLPRSGWARLEIPADAVGLEGKTVQGMSFAAYGVNAAWDRIGKTVPNTSAPPTDLQPPWVDITQPAAGATVSRSMNFVATGGDNLGVSRVEFYMDGSDYTVLVDHPSAPWTATWDTRNFSNGTHTLKVIVRDAAGNQASKTQTINIQNTDDVTRPTIAITSPTNGTTVSGDVLVQASASDNVGIDRVEFEANGVLIAVDNSAPYSATWNTRNVADGSYTLVVRAFDTSANMSATTITVAVNNSAPPPPPPPPPTGGNEVVWVEDAIPAGGWGGGNGGDGWNWVSTNPAPYSGTLAHQSSNSTGLHDHGFNGATPLAIQTGDQLMVYVYLNPAVPPQAVMLSWNDGSSWDHRAYWGADIIPYGTPNTPGHVRAGDLPAAGGWARLTVSAAAVGLEGRQVSGLSFILSNGSVTWDRAGKLGAGSPPPPPPPPASGDTTAPAVSLLNPANGATVSGVVSLRAQASDNQALGSLQIKVDGTVVAFTSASGPTADYSSSWNSATVANGSHTLNAIAVDAAGNQTTSASVAVTVSNGSPAVSVWMEDAIPVGGSPGAVGGDAWTWISNPSPASPSGAKVHQSANVSGYHEHSFNFAWYPLAVGTGDEIFVYVLIDPANLPKELILSWCDGSSWEHRAYWGENRVDFGINNTPSRHYYGPLPTAGGWVQLRIPASDVGLEGRSISGMAFGLFDGRASWDTVGKVGQ